MARAAVHLEDMALVPDLVCGDVDVDRLRADLGLGVLRASARELGCAAELETALGESARPPAAFVGPLRDA